MLKIEAERIKAVREGMNMTRAEFADYLGVTRQSVTNWETNKSEPTGPAVRLLLILEEQGNEG